MFTEKELKGMKRLSLRQAAMEVGIERSVSSTMSPDELVDAILDQQDDEGGSNGKKAKAPEKKSGGRRRKAKPPEPDKDGDEDGGDEEKAAAKKGNGKTRRSRSKAAPKEEPTDDGADLKELTDELINRLDAIGGVVDKLETAVKGLSGKVKKIVEDAVNLGAVETKLEELGEGQEEIGELILKFLEDSKGG
jgi:hypothetical protein